MDLFTFVLLVLILCAVLFLVYWFFRGAKGELSLARPVESRVDEYLDRRFQAMIEEWELVSGPRLRKFSEQHTQGLGQEEARLAELKDYQAGMQSTLASLEARLDTLETELAKKDSAKK